MTLINRLQKETVLFWLFSVLAVAIPLLVYFLPWTPEDQTRPTWFQRSGSIMVAFALVAEVFAIRFQNLLFPKSAFGNPEVENARKKYRTRPKIMNRSAFVLIAIGTIICGYGDFWI